MRQKIKKNGSLNFVIRLYVLVVIVIQQSAITFYLVYLFCVCVCVCVYISTVKRNIKKSHFQEKSP